MYYLIQRNVFQDPNYGKIFAVLEKLNLEYEIIDLIPFSTELNYKTNRKDVFVYGSVKLAKLATNYDWIPGSFYGKNHDYSIYSKEYKENLLNFDSSVTIFSAPLNWEKNEEKFIRPTKDAKVFTGKIFTKIKWEDFVERTLADEVNPIKHDSPIQVSIPKEIYKEARTWIVGGKVVASSYYRFHGDINYEENVCSEGLDFAKRMAAIFQVADAFVMDICDTKNGWKIVEVNCINSAGFYKGNVEEIVINLERYFNPLYSK